MALTVAVFARDLTPSDAEDFAATCGTVDLRRVSADLLIFPSLISSACRISISRSHAIDENVNSLEVARSSAGAVKYLISRQNLTAS